MEVRSHFVADEFGAELVGLLKAWQAEWCLQDLGPTTSKTSTEYAAFGSPAKMACRNKGTPCISKPSQLCSHSNRCGKPV